MATPAEHDFVISQGDTLPVMRIPIPARDGQLIDLTGCTVTFLGRVRGDRSVPPPVVRPVESHAVEQATAEDAAAFDIEEGDDIVAVYVKLETDDTKGVSTPRGQDFAEMSGELEVLTAEGDTLTIAARNPDNPYLTWWVRDDIGDGG